MGSSGRLDNVHRQLTISGQSQTQRLSSGDNAWLSINNTSQSSSQWPISGPHQESACDPTLNKTYQSHGQWPIIGPEALLRRQPVARHYNTHQSSSQWPISGPEALIRRQRVARHYNTHQSSSQWPISGPEALIRRQRMARHYKYTLIS